MKILIVILIVVCLVLGGLAIRYHNEAVRWEKVAQKSSELTDEALEIAKECRDALRSAIEKLQEIKNDPSETSI